MELLAPNEPVKRKSGCFVISFNSISIGCVGLIQFDVMFLEFWGRFIYLGASETKILGAISLIIAYTQRELGKLTPELEDFGEGDAMPSKTGPFIMSW